VRWDRPRGNGGAEIVGYQVIAVKVVKNGRVVSRTATEILRPGKRGKTMRLEPGRYFFRVKAVNEVGKSRSQRSRVVRAR
jgi:hypothetical protein